MVGPCRCNDNFFPPVCSRLFALHGGGFDCWCRDVRPWLDLVDELRAHGISQDLPLPQIAVMGDQSCGKSSVLEVQYFFTLPRFLELDLTWRQGAIDSFSCFDAVFSLNA